MNVFGRRARVPGATALATVWMIWTRGAAFGQTTDAGTTVISMTVHPLARLSSQIEAIAVRAELSGSLPRPQQFSVRAPIVYAGISEIADRVDSFVMTDASGAVPVSILDEPERGGGLPFYRHWRANRPVVPPVVLTYRMRPFTGTPGSGPEFDFYAHGGGMSAAGMALFLVPDYVANATTRVRWDLSDLSASAIAASTYGEGDFEITGHPDLLLQSYYMVGPLGRYIPPIPSSGFRAYWLGQPPFDPRREMEWTYQAYEYLRRFYRDTQGSPYRVFIRALPGASGTLGGTAMQNSFMVGTSSGPITSSATGPRNTIVHEMGHMWIGSLDGDRTGSATWFSEGLNEHYTRLLLLRSGLAPVADYEEEINGSAAGYFASPYRNAPADAIARLGFSTGMGLGSAQNLPYVRGSLYFATIDAKIRTVSGGRKTLDDLVLPLLERRRNGEPIDQAAFVDALVRELGPNARYEFESVIVRGEPLDPPSGAFGPCFDKQPTTFTLNGRQSNGFAWVRNGGMSDAQCRAW
jgi:hypothetical protein